MEVIESQEHGIFDDVLVAPTKPSRVGMIGSPVDGNVEERANNGVDLDCRETVRVHGTEHSPVWTGDQDEMALAAEGILKTEGDQDIGLTIEDSPFANYSRLFRRPVGAVIALHGHGEDHPAVVSQSWLYGHTTLQQTGQSIGAELEVAMLCMQKRLAKVKNMFCWIYCTPSAGLETTNSHTLHLHLDCVEVVCSCPSHSPTPSGEVWYIRL